MPCHHDQRSRSWQKWLMKGSWHPTRLTWNTSLMLSSLSPGKVGFTRPFICRNFKGRGVDLRLSKGFASRFNTKMEMVWSLKDTGHEKFPAQFVWLGSTSASWCEILHTPALRGETKAGREEELHWWWRQWGQHSWANMVWVSNLPQLSVSLFPELQLWWSHGIPSLAALAALAALPGELSRHQLRAQQLPAAAAQRCWSWAPPGPGDARGRSPRLFWGLLVTVSLLVEEVHWWPEPYQVAAAHFCEQFAQFAQSVLALCWGFRCLIAWPVDF